MDPFHSPTSYYPHSSTSNGHPVHGQSGARKNAQWSSFETNIFVAACETVIAEGHKNGKYFTKHGWDTLVNLFNTNSGHNWNKQQLKNRCDALRLKLRRFEELLNCTGILYDPSTWKIFTSDEWWARKIKENKDYKEFKDKDCQEVYRFKALFGDVFDSDKYAITPSKLCRTGFAMFEDSGHEDHLDEIPVNVESSRSSDEGEEAESAASSMYVSGPHNGNKRKSSIKRQNEKKKKFTA